MPKKPKFKYYNIAKLVKEYPEAYYYVVIGERSNGKTYSALSYALAKYVMKGEQFAYVRRYGEDIRPKQLTNLFNGHIENGLVRDLTNGQWDDIRYRNNKFTLIQHGEDGNVLVEDDRPMGYTFDLNSMEHYKSISFPGITSIIFDEFLSRTNYLPNEFLLFNNTVSTIVRLRTNVKIFMLGNTVNRYSPYFGEMGLTHVKDQKQGTIDVYTYGQSKLQVVVEYCAKSEMGKASDVYFAFDNPQLQMITTGAWEIAVYPHLPIDGFKPKDIVVQFFVTFEQDALHGYILSPSESIPFVYIHMKTTPIKNEKKDIVYSQAPDNLPNHRVGFARQKDKVSMFIKKCILENRVFYGTNEAGEVFRNYIMWCDQLTLRNR